MAKKKKTNTITSICAGNNLNAQGNVIVSYERNGKVIKKFSQHNEANWPLCKYLRDALYGNYVIAARPNKIKVCTLEGGTLKPMNYMSFFTATSTNKESNDYTLSLFFKLPYDNIQDKKIDGLMLYADNDNGLSSNSYYASIIFPTQLEATSNTNIKIEWQLIVTPKGV